MEGGNVMDLRYQRWYFVVLPCAIRMFTFRGHARTADHLYARGRTKIGVVVWCIGAAWLGVGWGDMYT